MRLVLGLLLIVSNEAFACPNLTGKYTCVSETPVELPQTIITQKIEDGVTVYEMISSNPGSGESITEIMKTNGEVEITTNGMFDIYTVSECEAGNLIAQSRIIFADEELANFHAVYHKEGETLKLSVTGMTPEGEINDQLICNP